MRAGCKVDHLSPKADLLSGSEVSKGHCHPLPCSLQKTCLWLHSELLSYMCLHTVYCCCFACLVFVTLMSPLISFGHCRTIQSCYLPTYCFCLFLSSHLECQPCTRNTAPMFHVWQPFPSLNPDIHHSPSQADQSTFMLSSACQLFLAYPINSLFFVYVEHGISWNPGLPHIQHLTGADPEVIFLPLKCWDCRCKPPCLASNSVFTSDTTLPALKGPLDSV